MVHFIPFGRFQKLQATSQSDACLMPCLGFVSDATAFCMIVNTAVSTKVVQLKSIKAYTTIPKGMMGCGCSLLHRQVHEFSAQWKAVL